MQYVITSSTYVLMNIIFSHLLKFEQFSNETCIKTQPIYVLKHVSKVPLNEVEFWIQIYDLPSGYMAESVGKQLGNFFGSFVAYDLSNNTSI